MAAIFFSGCRQAQSGRDARVARSVSGEGDSLRESPGMQQLAASPDELRRKDFFKPFCSKNLEQVPEMR
jgi:hypothetical protein